MVMLCGTQPDRKGESMTDKITVELDRELAENFIKGTSIHGGPIARVRDRLKAALPPEWEEGQMAVVRYWGADEDDLRRVFAKWHNGEWTFANGLSSNELRNNVTNVEPIRVLKDDEVAVKRPNLNSNSLRSVASLAKNEYYWETAAWLESVAGILEAEK